jgi:NADP-dependent 3-hydroxy acid dehydrogenase YdfG
VAPDGGCEHQRRPQWRRRRVADVHRAEIRARDCDFVGGGAQGFPNGAIYGGTKWFVRDFMEVLRMESAMEGTNIRTATIYPAAINTELLDAISHKETAEGMAKLYERFGISPDRIANVVAFAIDQPEDTTVNEFTVGPANQPW